MSYSKKIETFISEIKTEAINDKIQKYYSIITIKFIIFHSILFRLMIFNCYYLSLFCIIYNESQIKWFIGCLYTFIIQALINCLLSLALAGKRKFDFKYNNINVYNLQIFLKDKV